MNFFKSGEALSSDEDEIEEFGTSYLENVQNFATKKAADLGITMCAELKVFLFNSYYSFSVVILNFCTYRTTTMTKILTMMTIPMMNWMKQLWRVIQLLSMMRRQTIPSMSLSPSNK